MRPEDENTSELKHQMASESEYKKNANHPLTRRLQDLKIIKPEHQKIIRTEDKNS